MSRITIDLRMFRHSGIGRYLRNLIPPLLPLLSAESIRLVASRALLDEPGWLTGADADPRIELFESKAPVYSIAEQLLPLRGAYRDTSLLWVPHYNAPLFYRGPLALTMHDIAPLVMPEILGNDLKRTYARLLIERATAHASAVLCVSAFTAQELQQHVGTLPSKLSVVHSGLDESWPTDAEPHREPDSLPYLLYVGNVKPNKNLKLLLDAFALIQDQVPHCLVLAGRIRGFGTNDDAVVKQILSMGPRVRSAGEVTDAELIELYAGASALVLPSLYEGFGLPVLEAMQLGCPVFCSNVASLPEVAGDAALYFDPHDVASLVATLLRVSDQPLMDSLRIAGRARVQRFSYANCAAQTADVLNPLLKRLQ